MPKTGRVLSFPSRSVREPVTASGARATAHALLAVPIEERTPESRSEALRHPDILMAVLGLLDQQRESAPKTVVLEATNIFETIQSSETAIGVFDERDYFLGEAAYLAAVAPRLLGSREEATRWLDRADSRF